VVNCTINATPPERLQQLTPVLFSYGCCCSWKRRADEDLWASRRARSGYGWGTGGTDPPRPRLHRRNAAEEAFGFFRRLENASLTGKVRSCVAFLRCSFSSKAFERLNFELSVSQRCSYAKGGVYFTWKTACGVIAAKTQFIIMLQQIRQTLTVKRGAYFMVRATGTVRFAVGWLVLFGQHERSSHFQWAFRSLSDGSQTFQL